MTTSMKAAFTLTLEDKLSSGLNSIKQSFEALKQTGNQLTLGKLEKGADLLRAVGREVQNLTSDLRGVEAAADRGWAALKRMAAPRIQAMKGYEKQLFGKRGLGIGEEVQQRGQLGAIGGAIAGYSIIKPVQAYADFENTLRHIAITEKRSGPAVETEIARITNNLKAEALATGQNSGELSKAYTFLITTGMKPELVDQLMPTHAKAATAYNISSESMGQAVFALNDSFKIPHQEMGAALSAMAYAAKEAHFTVENFSQFLPSIGGRMQLLGMTGRPAADTAFAALETVVKNSSMPSQAATNFQDLMQYMTAPIATRSFKKQGIDLPKMLIDAEKQGVSPLDAFLGKLDALTHGKSPVQAAEIIGKLVHNQEAASAALSLLQHKDEFLRVRKLLGKVDQSTLDTDFDTAYRAPIVKLRTGTEAAEQLERDAGKGFEPIVSKLVDGLQKIVGGVDGLDAKFPGLTDAVFAVTGGMLALGAALAAIGFVAPAVAAGAGVVGGVLAAPVTIPAAMLGLALYGDPKMQAPLMDPYSFPQTIMDGPALTVPAPPMILMEPNSLPNSIADPRPTMPAPPMILMEPNSLPNTIADPRPTIDTTTVAPPAAPEPQKLDITVRADPGTQAEVTRVTPGTTVRAPDPGPTTGRP